jgi:hypothetical protein
MSKNALLDEIEEAHRLIVEWECTHFDLGSPFAHCAKLTSFAGPRLREAIEAGAVVIDMPSEFHAPRFRVVR